MAEKSSWREQRVFITADTIVEVKFLDTHPNHILITNNSSGYLYMSRDQLLNASNYELVIPAYGRKLWVQEQGLNKIFLFTEEASGANAFVISVEALFSAASLPQTQDMVPSGTGGYLGIVDVQTVLHELPAGTNNIGDVDIATMPSVTVDTLPALPTGTNVIGLVGIDGMLPAGTNNIGDVDIVTMPAVTVDTLPALPTGTNVIGSVGINGMLPAGTNNIGDVDIATMPAFNTEGTALESAARTASVNSPDIVNNYGKGVIVFVNITAVTDTPSIVVTIQGKDPTSGSYYDILSSPSLSQIGTTGLRVYPGIVETANQRANDILPKTWRVAVTHTDTDSITYSVGYSIV